MSTTSAAMHPASPMAACCVGDGPCLLSPSTTTVCVPHEASKRRSPDHTSSATSGGRASAISAGSARGGRMLRLVRGAAHQPFQCEPTGGQQHECVGQRMAEGAVGSPRLGRLMYRFTEWQHALFGHLMDAGNQQLHYKHEQKDRRDLKEESKVYSMSVPRPQ